MDKELSPKQQASEAIRQAETVLITSAARPTIDQVASVMALSLVLRKLGKSVSTLLSGELPAGAQFLDTSKRESALQGLRDFVMSVDLSHAEVDKLRYAVEDGKLNIYVTPFQGGFTKDNVSYSFGDYRYDIVIALGVSRASDLDKTYLTHRGQLKAVPLINIDCHRSNESFGAINHVDQSSATISEMMVAVSESLQGGLVDKAIATYLLAGINAATDRFAAPHTTAKALTVAAQMIAFGADQQEVVKGLASVRKSSSRPQVQVQAQLQPKQEVAQPITPVVAEHKPEIVPENEIAQQPMHERLMVAENVQAPEAPTDLVELNKSDIEPEEEVVDDLINAEDEPLDTKVVPGLEPATEHVLIPTEPHVASVPAEAALTSDWPHVEPLMQVSDNENKPEETLTTDDIIPREKRANLNPTNKPRI